MKKYLIGFFLLISVIPAYALTSVFNDAVLNDLMVLTTATAAADATKVISIATDGITTDFHNGTTWTPFGMVNTAGSFQYGCYIDDSNSFTVFKRDLGDDSITTQSYTLSQTVDVDDFHQSCGVGVDANEDIHVSGFSHTGATQEALVYYKSTTAADITSLSAQTQILDSAGVGEDQVTYLQFFRDEATDKLYVTWRDGGSGAGDQYLAEYNTSTEVWDLPGDAGTDGIFIEGTTGTDRGVYMIDIPVVKNGFIYLPGTLRLTNQIDTNHDVFFVKYNISDNQFEKVDGTDYASVPIAWSDLEIIDNVGDGTTDEGMTSQGAMCAKDNGDVYIAYVKEETNLNNEIYVIPVESNVAGTPIKVSSITGATGLAWDGLKCFTDQTDEAKMAIMHVDRTEDARPINVYETSNSWSSNISYTILDNTNQLYTFLPWDPTMQYELGYHEIMIQPTDVSSIGGWGSCTGKCGVTPSGVNNGGDGDNRVKILHWAFGDQDAEMETNYIGTFNGTTAYSDHGNAMDSEGASDLTVIMRDFTPLDTTEEGIFGMWDQATAAQRNFTMQENNDMGLIVGIELDDPSARTCYTANSAIVQDTTYDIGLRWDGGDNLDIDVLIDGVDTSCTLNGGSPSGTSLTASVTEKMIVGGYDEGSGSLTNYNNMKAGDLLVWTETFSDDKAVLASQGANFSFNLKHWFKFEESTYNDKVGSADGTLSNVTIAAE